MKDRFEDKSSCLELGNKAFLEGRYIEALDYYKTVLDINPDRKDIWENVGVICEEFGLMGYLGKINTKILSIEPRSKFYISTDKQIKIMNQTNNIGFIYNHNIDKSEINDNYMFYIVKKTSRDLHEKYPDKKIIIPVPINILINLENEIYN